MNNFQNYDTDTSKNLISLLNASEQILQLQNTNDFLEKFYNSQLTFLQQLRGTQGFLNVNTPYFELTSIPNSSTYNTAFNSYLNTIDPNMRDLFYKYFSGSFSYNGLENDIYNYSNSFFSKTNNISNQIDYSNLIQQICFYQPQIMNMNQNFSDFISTMSTLNSLKNNTLINQKKFNNYENPAELKFINSENTVRNPSSEKSTLEISKIQPELVNKEHTITSEKNKADLGLLTSKIPRIVTFKTKEILMRKKLEDKILKGSNERNSKCSNKLKNLKIKSKYPFYIQEIFKIYDSGTKIPEGEKISCPTADRESFMNEAKQNLKNEENDVKISCNHTNCEAKFKTRRQKLTHHMKCDFECKKEKNSLIRMISNFKEAIQRIAKKNPSEKNKNLVNIIKNELKDFTVGKDPLRLEYFKIMINFEE